MGIAWPHRIDRSCFRFLSACGVRVAHSPAEHFSNTATMINDNVLSSARIVTYAPATPVFVMVETVRP